MNKELRRLEDAGILTSVAYSDRGSSIVAVIKADGQIRICGNFKATVKPYINTEQYPLTWYNENEGFKPDSCLVPENRC